MSQLTIGLVVGPENLMAVVDSAPVAVVVAVVDGDDPLNCAVVVVDDPPVILWIGLMGRRRPGCNQTPNNT